MTEPCTCAPYPYGDGPEVDCPVHGAVRALNDATREIAALADALGHPEVTHDFVLYPRLPLRCDRVGCARSRDAAVHRTPARVRAELEQP